VNILAGAVVLEGLITANGDQGSGWQAGSGSGGTVNIAVSTLSGAGTITVNGGAREVGGGGGRIAVYYDNSTFTGQAVANGGDGNYADGQPGTVNIQKR
jgi:hypothetical protein